LTTLRQDLRDTVVDLPNYSWSSPALREAINHVNDVRAECVDSITTILEGSSTADAGADHIGELVLRMWRAHRIMALAAEGYVFEIRRLHVTAKRWLAEEGVKADHLR
jgi:hypothetical protein